MAALFVQMREGPGLAPSAKRFVRSHKFRSMERGCPCLMKARPASEERRKLCAFISACASCFTADARLTQQRERLVCRPALHEAGGVEAPRHRPGVEEASGEIAGKAAELENSGDLGRRLLAGYLVAPAQA